MKTKIVNLNTSVPYDVYIGRGSIWGNPFPITDANSRTVVIAMYRKYILMKFKFGEIRVERLISLKGKTLGCHCKPQACHGDVLIELIGLAETAENMKLFGIIS